MSLPESRLSDAHLLRDGVLRFLAWLFAPWTTTSTFLLGDDGRLVPRAYVGPRVLVVAKPPPLPALAYPVPDHPRAVDLWADEVLYAAHDYVAAVRLPPRARRLAEDVAHASPQGGTYDGEALLAANRAAYRARQLTQPFYPYGLDDVVQRPSRGGRSRS